jgi:hypothetical protein
MLYTPCLHNPKKNFKTFIQKTPNKKQNAFQGVEPWSRRRFCLVVMEGGLAK